MSNKPNIRNFLEVNSKGFHFRNTPDALVYEDEAGNTYKEVNAFRNRLLFEVPFALFGAIMYILSSVMPELKMWDVGIYVMILCAVFIFLISFIYLRYFIAKFEPIENEKEAAGTGYRQVEFAMVIVPALMLFLI